MLSDGVLIHGVWQPLHMLSWTGAAMSFLSTKNDFVRVERKMTAGRWSPICFQIRGLVGKQLAMFTDADFHLLRRIISELRQIELIEDMEEAFQIHLEYPPFHIDDDWDGKAGLRRTWARHVHDTEARLRF